MVPYVLWNSRTWVSLRLRSTIYMGIRFTIVLMEEFVWAFPKTSLEFDPALAKMLQECLARHLHLHQTLHAIYKIPLLRILWSQHPVFGAHRNIPRRIHTTHCNPLGAFDRLQIWEHDCFTSSVRTHSLVSDFDYVMDGRDVWQVGLSRISWYFIDDVDNLLIFFLRFRFWGSNAFPLGFSRYYGGDSMPATLCF